MSATEKPKDDGKVEWRPPDGDGWGEGSIQARRARGDDIDAREWHTDAYEMRMRFGVPPFDADAFGEYQIYPDRLIHEKPAEETSTAGGTDWLKVGERGCGKSTDNLNWALRLMECNDERVIWRGATARSEWLPFADYATLWLPANADVAARWVFEDGRGAESVDADELENVVRDVRYYDDVLDLIHELDEHPRGTFNVVYPDPAFEGCSDLTRRTSRTAETLPFTAAWETDAGESGTPLTHWWFAFFLARVEFADSSWWTSVMFDEAGEFCPDSVEQDEHRTYAKLLLFQSVMIDSRREKLSFFATVHREKQLHWRIREEFMTRVDMPDGTPNPRKRRARSIPQGFKTVPMYADVMSKRKPGTALMYDESQFSLYKWTNIKGSAEGDRVLKFEFARPGDLGGEREVIRNAA